MVEDRASPSAGWREVYDEMGVDADAEESTRDCPDCGRRCDGVLGDVYECPDHGVFRASASDDESERESPDAEDARESERHARGRAD